MKNNKKLGIVLLLWMVLIGIWIQPMVGKAQAQEITEADFQMVGGQIRTTTPMGLRFIAKIKKDYIAQQEQEGKIVEYGIVLLPKAYLGEKELTADGTYLYKGKLYKPAVIPGAKKFAEKDGNIYYTAVLTNIAKERYKNEYAARAYVKLTERVVQSDGKTTTKSQWKYGDETIPKQVYEIAKEAVKPESQEEQETKEWIQNNILDPVDRPQGPTEEDKKIPFRLGKVEGVTLYRKTDASEQNGAVEEVSNFMIAGFEKEQYLVKVELNGQPEVFAEIRQVDVTAENKVNFVLNLDDYVTEGVARQQEGAIVEFGTAEDGVASTKYITMQALVDKINANPSGTFELDHNLDASMVQGADELIANFSGTFDGKGHKITGLNTTLFGTVSGGTVKNVILENVAITKTYAAQPNDNGAGILADKLEKQARVEGVHISGTLKNQGNRQIMGGLVGRMDRATVEQCSVNLEISGSYNTVGGLVGQMSNGTQFENVIKDSYAVGSIKGSMSNGALGGLIGWHNNKNNNVVQNCYTAMSMNIEGTGNSGYKPGGFIGIMGESDATGTLANNVAYSNGNKGRKFDGASDKTKYQKGTKISQNVTLKETRLESDVIQGDVVNNEGKILEKAYDELLNKDFYVNNLGWSEEVWDFEPLKEKKAPVLKNGDPNRIGMLQLKEVSTVEELRAINNDLNGVYVLTADIDVSGITSGNSIIGDTFRGLLKGNGHQITGQKIPLFNFINRGTVEDLILTDADINRQNDERIGVLAREVYDKSIIQNVYVRNTKISAKNFVGGLVGHLNNSTAIGCSVVAQVDGKEAGGFISNIMNVSTVTDCYAQRTTDPKTFGDAADVQGGFVAKMNKSTVTNTYAELKFTEETQPKTIKAVTAKVGSFIGENGTADRIPAKVENNIAFGPEGYLFNASNKSDADFAPYKNNYEYQEGRVTEQANTPNLTDKIIAATAAQVNDPNFYKETLKWDTAVWHLDDVAGGKRPRLEAEGDIYPSETPDSEENTPETTVAPEESIALMAARSQEERAGKESWDTVAGYQAERKMLYDNLEKFMPFYNRAQIVKDGNALDINHKLNQKPVVAVYPMDENGRRIVALTKETVGP